MHVCIDCPIPLPLHRWPMHQLFIPPVGPRLVDPPVVIARSADGKGWVGSVP